MSHKITIEKLIPAENYFNKEEIFSQTVDEINLLKIIEAVNSVEMDKVKNENNEKMLRDMRKEFEKKNPLNLCDTEKMVGTLDGRRVNE